MLDRKVIDIDGWIPAIPSELMWSLYCPEAPRDMREEMAVSKKVSCGAKVTVLTFTWRKN